MKLWITSVNREEDKAHLESLGIKVGNWKPDPDDPHPHATKGRGDFEDCEVPDEAMDKLNDLWGTRYIWGPMPGQQL